MREKQRKPKEFDEEAVYFVWQIKDWNEMVFAPYGSMDPGAVQIQPQQTPAIAGRVETLLRLRYRLGFGLGRKSLLACVAVVGTKVLDSVLQISLDRT